MPNFAAGGFTFKSSSPGGIEVPANSIADEAGADALGLVTANPAANTLLGRRRCADDQ